MKFKSELEQAIIATVQQEVVPALGCTEPVSLALAAAVARQYLGALPDRIEAKVSPNLMKNGMGVTVPGTGTVGLTMAAAIGAIGGDPKGGLEVLKQITAEQVALAKQMINDHKIEVSISDTEHILYSEATLFNTDQQVKVRIAAHHTNVIYIEKNGELLFSKPCVAESENAENVFANLNAKDIYNFSLNVELEKIRFIQQAAILNSALSQEGLNQDYGLHIGRTLQKQIGKGLISDDLLNRIVIETTAASDARMGGANLPAMSNSGSGNQGITATMPVVVVARHVAAGEEQLIRALFLSHLMAIYIHSKLPRLSALCAVTTAAMGSCAGVAWLLTGKFEAISMAISSMIGDISGIICDGAANSCAMKVSTSVSSSYKSILMALDDTQVTGNEGIVEHQIDRSINNLCAIASRSMQYTDRQVIEIMVSKPKSL
ncbi:serine dehydratase subunit alpha family protein [Actinobacillus pleuropneumoniae]|uniref:L-cysteine desulfidase family protein n=1 Tax=Actinobacillus pleuropneumoniae TaxID=715 RepID=UPI0005855A1B|nr:L-serine ammonia-lyase, iron-sulfur-dependent, subunit alpha [Actinobacillus pleuropneumoniae]KIE89118.1 putative membrane protein [Actinobacillus pleuropneumoniae]KIE95562.1 putative membrane protein [Actinobacillus pleuropneumoniae]KIE95795.1 putative membrane protein [Actinobacillus pleuropneumoniae]QXP23645.1 L-serine ammonia-lyase, iron-sulfur-dependent, subunit alpha [Actinobacillus pleuropneumoniae serovar 8 str. 405]UKH37647.1 serine dehydratase subunit alpha family protein [Actinob